MNSDESTDQIQLTRAEWEAAMALSLFPTVSFSLAPEVREQLEEYKEEMDDGG